MNIDWNQSGMPMPLVSSLGRRNEFAEFKSVLNDAGNQVMTPVDAEAMARELVEAGGPGEADSAAEPRDEWAEWDRKFQSLLG